MDVTFRVGTYRSEEQAGDVVSKEDLIGALNSGDIFVRLHRDWIRDNWPKPSTAEYLQAQNRFRSLLRELVDSWIRTGIDDRGVECPGRRTFEGQREADEPNAYGTLTRFVNKNPAELNFLDDGSLETWIALYEGSENLLELADREATRFFVWFMLLSDGKRRFLRNTLVKCKKCGRYFAIKNTHRGYKRGAYCRAHNPSAKAVTEERRAAKHNALVELAASAVTKWQKWSVKAQEKKPLKNFIVEYVNHRTPEEMKGDAPKSPITGKWVTHNLRDIQSLGHRT